MEMINVAEPEFRDSPLEGAAEAAKGDDEEAE